MSHERRPEDFFPRPDRKRIIRDILCQLPTRLPDFIRDIPLITPLFGATRTSWFHPPVVDFINDLGFDQDTGVGCSNDLQVYEHNRRDSFVTPVEFTHQLTEECFSGVVCYEYKCFNWKALHIDQSIVFDRRVTNGVFEEIMIRRQVSKKSGDITCAMVTFQNHPPIHPDIPESSAGNGRQWQMLIIHPPDGPQRIFTMHANGSVGPELEPELLRTHVINIKFEDTKDQSHLTCAIGNVSATVTLAKQLKQDYGVALLSPYPQMITDSDVKIATFDPSALN